MVKTRDRMGSFPPAPSQHFSMGSAPTTERENGRQNSHGEVMLLTSSLSDPFHPLLCEGIGRPQWP